MSRGLKYAFGAIALYLVVAYSTGSGNTLVEGSKGAARVITAFQGGNSKNLGL